MAAELAYCASGGARRGSADPVGDSAPYDWRGVAECAVKYDYEFGVAWAAASLVLFSALGGLPGRGLPFGDTRDDCGAVEIVDEYAGDARGDEWACEG